MDIVSLSEIARAADALAEVAAQVSAGTITASPATRHRLEGAAAALAAVAGDDLDALAARLLATPGDG